MVISAYLIYSVYGAVDPVSTLANYGALGLFVAAFMLGLVFSKATVDRLIQERDRADERAEKILEDYKAVAPLLERAIEVMRQADQKATESATLSAQMRSSLDANTRALDRISSTWDRR